MKAKTPEGMGTDNAAIAHAVVLLEKKAGKRIGVREKRKNNQLASQRSRLRLFELLLVEPSYCVCACASHQRAENCPRAFVIFHRTFRVPLHGHDEMIGRCAL